MKWITIRTWKHKKQAKECWHIWWAWYPITVHEFPDGAKCKVWLRNVYRKGKYDVSWDGTGFWEYEYTLGLKII